MAASTSTREEAPNINVKEFLEQWGEESDYNVIPPGNVEESIAKRMNVSNDIIKELSEVCSPSALWNTNESADRKAIFEGIPSGVDLETVKCQIEELEMRRKNPTYANHVMRKMKYNLIDCHRLFKHDENSRLPRTDQDTSVKKPNVVLTVDVHKPFQNKPTSRLVISETYLVLGTNKLTELRDVIKCANDYAVSGDLSLTPDIKDFTYAKDIFKSGFMFVEDTFYNDMRHPDNRDYSQNIQTWVSQDKRWERLGPFKSAKMEDTTFLDLDIVVGKPYFYQHQGDCEHILIFSDLRMFHPLDPQDIRSYPYLAREMNHRRKICKTCLINTAGWIVYNCALVSANPSFMCHRCFKSLLYDANGKKLGSFEAYKSSEHPS